MANPEWDNYDPMRQKWRLRILHYNTFNGMTIVQILKDDEIRGSFTVDTENEQVDLKWWREIFGRKDE